ncbi:MAG: hypothetical protein Kow00121_22860 [Elainellaceae cyanobacterium]
MYRLAIVDDNESWCFVLALWLEQQGYTVSTFTNAHTFLEEVDRFDLVLVDFSLPAPRYRTAIDGPEVICKVRNCSDNPPLLVLISGFFTEDFLGQATEICPEADAVWSKQLDAKNLVYKVEQLLTNRIWTKSHSDRASASAHQRSLKKHYEHHHTPQFKNR